jgi:hypothetical protein
MDSTETRMPPTIPLIVHATHEAGLKLGGIGAVLDGFLTSAAYNQTVKRTILVGPVNTWNAVEMERLFAPGNKLNVIYSTLWGHETNNAPEQVAFALGEIERRMNVRFLYGTRTFGGREVEVILVDAGVIAAEVINSYKFYLWQRWGLPASLHESNWEFSFFLNSGEPLIEALRVITADLPRGSQRYLIAHEWLGLPVVFSALLRDENPYRTIFYAHEVATARLLVEGHGGHDTRFYNALRLGLTQGASVDQVFGDQSWFYKHAMILRAGICDRIFAVGDPVVDELRFLGGVFGNSAIDLVYNGVPSAPIRLEQKMASRELLLQYAENLYGFRPDFIFTHVTRMVPSKALWRDVRVLEHLEWTLAAAGKRAVFFIVSTSSPTGRRSEDVFRWEREYGWPLGHRGDNGDLVGDEVRFFFDVLEPFHWGRSATKIALVNQFGWERARCGNRMPEAMRFADLRNGADLEFGQSIYEPFGIAQVEPLSSGALCVPSNVCGCIGFLNRSWGAMPPNVIVGDYVSIPPEWRMGSPWDALRIDGAVRDSIEGRQSWHVAQQIWERLPKNDDQRRWLLEQGQQAAGGMSWDVVVNEYFLPSLSKAR